MLNPDFHIGGAAGFPALSDAPRTNGAAGGFGDLYRQLNAEVNQFIERGDAAGSLSPEAQVHRMQTGPVEAPSADQQAWLDRIAPLA